MYYLSPTFGRRFTYTKYALYQTQLQVRICSLNIQLCNSNRSTVALSPLNSIVEIFGLLKYINLLNAFCMVINHKSYLRKNIRQKVSKDSTIFLT